MGLRLKEQEGPRFAPTPFLRGGGPHLGAQQASWARVGGANALRSSPAPPGGPLPPASPDLLGLPLAPKDPCGLEGALEEGYWPGSSAGSQGWVGQAIALCSSPAPPRGPSRLPLLISPGSGAPILSGLHFSSPLCPPHPTGSLGGSSHLLGHQGPPFVSFKHCTLLLGCRLFLQNPSFHTFFL